MSDQTETAAPAPKLRRGFACMTPERRTEISRKGGASTPAHKRSFAVNRDLAASAGKAGGKAPRGGRDREA